MATLLELANIIDDSSWGDFRKKVKAAAIKKATAIIDSATPPQTALDWASAALNNPVSAGDNVISYVVGANAGVDIATILSASDSAIQTNVDAAVDALYGS